MTIYKKLYLIVLTTVIFCSQLLAQLHGVSYTDITKEAGIGFRYNFGDYTYEKIYLRVAAPV